MSRIHDALKKAEEQLLANIGSEPDLAVEEKLPERFPDIALELVANGALPESPVSTVAPEPISNAALDPILQQCSPTVWTPTSDALFLSADTSHAPGLEEFRTLRSRLFQLRAKRPVKTLLISSALPGEGKSFVSANLAQAFAKQRGGRTLLIDADLRKPHMHELLGAPGGPGLFEFLSGKAREGEIIQKSQYDDLFFIPAGRVTSSSAELVGNGRIAQLLKRLSPIFNWIIIDSSPVIPVSDPTRLAELCDGVLLVVCSGSTPHVLAERAKREFSPSPILGVVLNRVPRRDNPYYKYSYGTYGNQSGEIS